MVGKGKQKILLGCGHHRSVWVHDMNPEEAVKVCHRFTGGEVNQKEWDIYHSVDDKTREQLIRPIAIADDGTWMITERAEPVTKKNKGAPDYIRDIFRDHNKAANWGRVNGKMKLLDYHRLNKTITINGKQFNKGSY